MKIICKNCGHGITAILVEGWKHRCSDAGRTSYRRVCTCGCAKAEPLRIEEYASYEILSASEGALGTQFIECSTFDGKHIMIDFKKHLAMINGGKMVEIANLRLSFELANKWHKVEKR